jgi:peptide/nickel transport system substrate-binding protein
MRIRNVLVSLCCILAISFIYVQQTNSASGKKLIVTIDSEPARIDPTLAEGAAATQVLENCAEYLIQKTPNGKLIPGLATSWKISPDGKAIEFTLRKGVKFHNGDPLTVRDVQFSFERMQTKNPTAKSRLRHVDKFEIIDDDHFKFNFKQPDVTFIPYRGPGMIVSKTYYDKVGEEQFIRQPIGTGPYRLTRYAPGEYIDLERFEGYWGPKPSIKEARLQFVPEETTRVAKLMAGEVDLIENVPYPSLNSIEKNPDFKVIRLATNHPTQAITFNTKNPKTPWFDKRVRLAMAYAIDCDGIRKMIASGIPNRWAFLAPGEIGYDPSLKPYPYDPKKARELLAEAGYPNGFEFNLYWLLGGRGSMQSEVSQAVAGYLAAVGLNPVLIGEEFAAGRARRSASKGANAEYILLGVAARAGGVDPTQFLDMSYGTTGGNSVYSNAEFDKIIAQALATLDDTKRAELIKRVVRITYDDIAAIPIFNAVSLYAMKKNIDFKPMQNHSGQQMLVKDMTMR